jgi:fatty acid amide hydrolase 2
MKEAGAICLGITNCPELAFWWDSDNMLHGRTNNPYDLSRIPGGSTGGGAAVVAYAGSVLQLGGDIGGSIRMPCFFNGVWGHKPTPFIVDCSGHYPVIDIERQKFLGLGPITRYASDLMPMFKVMAGEESLKNNLPDIDDPVDISKLKIYYMLDCKDPLSISVKPEIKAAIMSLVHHLRTVQGCHTEEVFFKEFQEGQELFLQNFRIMRPDHPPFEEAMTDFKGKANLPLEFFKKLFNQSDHTLVTLLLALNDKVVRKTSPSGRQKWVEKLQKLKTDFYKKLGDDGIFLYPVHPEPAPKHKTTILKSHHTQVYCSVINTLEVPVTQCPLGLTQNEGLPIGIQVIAGPKKDRLTLALALEIEKRFGGWISPSLVNISN